MGAVGETQERMLGTLRLVSPVAAIDVGKRRVGGDQDGGYVMLDDLDSIGVCYSLGVGPDVSWDREMAQRGAHVFQYDHTVETAPAEHERFHHFRTGITHDPALAPAFKRIDALIEENGHLGRDDMVLKIDIEGHEWDSLDALAPGELAPGVLGGFRQIVAEFHGLRLLDSESFRDRAHRVFSMLRQTHEVVHVHGNNFAGMFVVEGIAIADCLELTYASRRHYRFGPTAEIFPGPLDRANNPAMPDLFLGNYQY